MFEELTPGTTIQSLDALCNPSKVEPIALRVHNFYSGVGLIFHSPPFPIPRYPFPSYTVLIPFHTFLPNLFPQIHLWVWERCKLPQQGPGRKRIMTYLRL